jgi:hypothetical protein
MNARIRSSVRSQSDAAVADRRTDRCTGTTRTSLAGSWRRVPLLLGLLLALAAAPFHGSQIATRAQELPQGAVLEDPGVPAAASWVVLEVSGTAAWRVQGEPRWRAFELGEVLPPGCEIETGADGQIILAAGGDQLIVAPHGRLLLPEAAPGQDRRLRHERGRIRVHIESREGRDVRIDTPLLSLGIKGTTFDVEVDSEQNSVVVHDGKGQVTIPDQQDPVDLGTGEGLRQPAAPGSSATRFTLPEHQISPGPADRAGWRLNPAGTTAVQEPGIRSSVEVDGAGASTRSAGGQRRGDRAQASSSRAETRLGRLDELAASWSTLAIAVVALLILTIPVLALLHNLREQWLGRAGAKGRRRRELVRG